MNAAVAAGLRRVLVTDRRRTPGADFVAAVLSNAGAKAATMIVLREKDLADAELGHLAGALVHAARIPVVVAHHAGVAAAAGARGVHLGWNSGTVGAARQRVGNRLLVGVSVHSVEEGVARAREGADYLFLGPILPTPKELGELAPLGFDELRRLAAAVAVPVVGIGGLSFEHASEVGATGAAGFAAIRAFLGA